MSDAPDPDRLKALDDKIRAAKGTPEPAKVEEHYSQAQMAWRMVIELVAGLLVGFGIGYGLDSLLGTVPWMILIFTMLGFVAGVRVMLRTAQEVQREQEMAHAAKKEDGDRGRGS